MGLVADGDDETGNRCMFKNAAGGYQTWYAQSYDGTLSGSSTGVAHGNNVPIRFKVEYRGYDAIGNVAGEPRALYYIDDNLVADHSSNVPLSDLCMYFKVSTTANSSQDFEIGPVKLTIAHVTTPGNL